MGYLLDIVRTLFRMDGQRSEKGTSMLNACNEKVTLWLRAVRSFSFTASITPVLLGGVLAISFQGPVAWYVLPIFLICSVLFHAGTNLINDYYDFKKGVDKNYTFGSSGILVENLIPPREIFNGAMVLFGIGFFLGLFLVSLRGIPILILGLIGILGGYSYTGKPFGYKYIALGDVFVFILMGVLLVVGSYFALTGDYSHRVLFVSFPIAALVTAILHSNNLRDIEYDRQAGVKTLAGILGCQKAKIGYYVLVTFAYFSIIGMMVSGILSVWSLIVFLSLPQALRNIKTVKLSEKNNSQSLAVIDQETAKLHLLFGILLIISVIIGHY